MLAEERHFMNGIRSGLLLGGLYFDIFIDIPLIYLCFVAPYLSVFVRQVQRPFLLIIYLPFKKILHIRMHGLHVHCAILFLSSLYLGCICWIF
jgi:hypothetical protein